MKKRKQRKKRIGTSRIPASNVSDEKDDESIE